ncbi:MAG TPA: hypothetical protein VI168_14200 [Croceibacterium sp.]
MTRREGLRLALALLVGAALAFPAGLLVAGLGDDPADDRPRARAAAAPAVRDVYSPALRSDPWFIERQRAGIEALESHCRESGENCAEARAARRWLDEQAGP